MSSDDTRASNGACRAGYLRVLADPADSQARIAYARELLRAGRRVAAACEFNRAENYEPGPDERTALRFSDHDRGLWTLRWFARDGATAVVRPDVRCGCVPEAIVEQGERNIPVALVLVACSACSNGTLECSDCNGRGFERSQFLTTVPDSCGECHGSGVRPCADCSGSAILKGRIAPGAACRHDALAPELLDHDAMPFKSWGLVRCRNCGLAALEFADGSRRFACADCGFFGCACGRARP